MLFMNELVALVSLWEVVCCFAVVSYTVVGRLRPHLLVILHNFIVILYEPLREVMVCVYFVCCYRAFIVFCSG